MRRQILIDARKEAKLTQCQMASQIGIHQAAYCNIENGKRDPSVKLAKKIGEILEMDWAVLFEK